MLPCLRAVFKQSFSVRYVVLIKIFLTNFDFVIDNEDI